MPFFGCVIPFVFLPIYFGDTRFACCNNSNIVLEKFVFFESLLMRIILDLCRGS
jgi:hypothetical protein